MPSSVEDTQDIYVMWGGSFFTCMLSGAYISEVPQLQGQSVLLHTKEYDEHRNMHAYI